MLYLLLILFFAQAIECMFNADGQPTLKFRQQLDALGFVPEQKYPEFDRYHIKNIYTQLYPVFFRDNDHLEYYRDGGVPTHSISNEQAKSYLDIEYGDRKAFVTQENADAALVPCGVMPTMVKRFKSLKTYFDRGCHVKNIYFLMADATFQDSIKEALEKHPAYRLLLEKVAVHMVIAGKNVEVFETCLTRLPKEFAADNESYIIVTDPNLAYKNETIARARLSQKYQGIVAVPFTDWQEEMELFRYNDHRAWAYSDLNFKVRAIKTQIEKEFPQLIEK